jgi:DNA-binding beta-propeller fold protein YncE
MQVLPNVHIDGRDSYGYPIPDGIHIVALDSTGFDIVTATTSAPVSGTLCPQVLTFTSNDPLRQAQRVELGQGTIQPINFFASPDGTQLYVVNASSSTILAYNFVAGAVVGGIELVNNANPLSADATVDTGIIMVAGNDGLLHQVSTSLTGADLFQIPFPNLPNYLNPFCTNYSSTGVCALNAVVVRP